MRVTYIMLYNRNGSSEASYNRVCLLSSGLINNGVASRIITLPVSNSKFLNIRRIYSIAALVRVILKLVFAKKNDYVIIYGEYMHLGLAATFKNKRVRLLIERNEYSEYQIRDHLPDSAIARIRKFEQNLSSADGFVTCSGYLECYYRQFTKKDCPYCIIPLVVDIDKFKQMPVPPEKYIAYCGDFGGNKDGLPILLDAFAKIVNRYPAYKLYLIGSTTDLEVMNQLNQQIEKLGILQKVVMTGQVSHSEMPRLLGAASLLVLARPANKQAEGGVPSKLAEYLSTGRPTLVTRVGELDRYFIDEKDLFFAEPDSADAFAAKIDSILSAYASSEKIAQNGLRSVAQFDYRKQGKILKDFLNNRLIE